ncbi:hypothetical protein B484DRAFT_349292 [Ochromonadaceae sp. CCMP2298]|nr:hypothetical protein B484DRAFT_349292 [Ochromonadaceae sp. CCMP2298]
MSRLDSGPCLAENHSYESLRRVAGQSPTTFPTPPRSISPAALSPMAPVSPLASMASLEPVSPLSLRSPLALVPVPPAPNTPLARLALKEGGGGDAEGQMQAQGKNEDGKEDKLQDGKIVDTETKSKGEVGWETYWFYLKACGGIVAVVGLLMGTAGTSLAWLFTNIALGHWMDAMQSGHSAATQQAFQLYLISVCVVLGATMARTVSQVASNLLSSKKLHEGLIVSVMMAPCSWFDATPTGRIVNRFSQDISTVDSNIILHMYGFMDCLLQAVQILGVICVSIPLLLVPFLPIVAYTWWVSKQYLHVSRELKRLESITKSPVFVLFSETLQGLPVVRAFREEHRFFSVCCGRIDEMNRCHLYLWISNRWLNFRMEVLGGLVAGTVGLAVVLQRRTIGSTVAGIALIYSLSFCDALTFLARAHANAQMDLNSIERISEYSRLTPEKYQMGSSDSSENSKGSGSMGIVGVGVGVGCVGGWPSEGRVEFKGISLSYASNSTPVLRDVSLLIPGRTKVGIVGRTGAGKSSLIAALFRLVEPTGQLLLDGVDVLQIPLHTLRGNVAIVPQEPTLFRGSVRFNLDPFGQHEEGALWEALRQAHIADFVEAMDSGGGLDAGAGGGAGGDEVAGTGGVGYAAMSLESRLVAEKGANFSVGQRQLLCMARAILRNAPVLVLDECTASVDHETDALIQQTVRRLSCSVICIAHRLHTIAYYDQVLVMDKGSVAESGDPYVLMQDPNSLFHSMCVTSGDYEELLALAKAGHEQRLR